MPLSRKPLVQILQRHCASHRYDYTVYARAAHSDK
jgi:hypothetical protein